MARSPRRRLRRRSASTRSTRKSPLPGRFESGNGENNDNRRPDLAAIEVKVPDIGDFKDVPVIEVLVKPGDAVKKDDSLITLESDKATMEVPAPSSGTVREIRVKVGDKVSEGIAILTLEAAAAAATARPPDKDTRGQAIAAAPAQAGGQLPAPKGPKGSEAPAAAKAGAPAPPPPAAASAPAPPAAPPSPRPGTRAPA